MTERAVIMHGKPSATLAELRQFGYLMAGFVALVFGLLLPWLAFGGGPWLPALPIAAAFALAGAAAPRLLKPLFICWTALGRLLGRIVSPAVLALFFYLAIWPTGLLRKLFGGDPLRRRWEPEVRSYFQKADALRPNHMEDPY